MIGICKALPLEEDISLYEAKRIFFDTRLTIERGENIYIYIYIYNLITAMPW